MHEFAQLLMSIAGLGLPMGLIMVMSGRVRYRNELDTFMRMIAAFCISVIAYWAVGYGLYSGDTIDGFVGLTKGFFHRSDLMLGETDLRRLILFSVPPIAAAAAMVERGRFHGGNFLSLAVAVLIAPVVAHWSWHNSETGAGWLVSRGFQDIGGSNIIFICSGFVGLAISLAVGARAGRFPMQVGRPRGHSPTWYGVGVVAIVFSGTSLTVMQEPSVQEMSAAIYILFIGASFATLSGSFLALIIRKEEASQHVSTSVVAGTVALTSIANFAEPADAALIGMLAGTLSVGFSKILASIELDDPGDLISAFLSGGLVGGLMAPLTKEGFGNSLLDEFVVQLMGIGAIAVWAFGVTLFLALILRVSGLLRVSEIDEKRGLSVTHFGFISEPDFMISNATRNVSREVLSSGARSAEVTRLSSDFSEAIASLHRATNRATERILASTSEPQKGAAMVLRIRLAEDSLRVKAEDILMLLEEIMKPTGSGDISSEQFLSWGQDVLDKLLAPVLEDIDKLARHIPLQAELGELENIIITAAEIVSNGVHQIELLRDLEEAQLDGLFARDHICDLAQLLADKQARIQVLAELRNRPVQIDCPVTSGLTVTGDANVFSRILTLTVEGALNRQLENGMRPVRLELREHSSGQYVVLDCLDTGVTLSARQIRAIRDPLSEDRAIEDLGLRQILPLILASRLVNAMGGEFAISSEHEVGTHLRCRFRKKVKKRQATSRKAA
nr:hypothetical protein [uncultured Cohaesibacter sp.]